MKRDLKRWLESEELAFKITELGEYLWEADDLDAKLMISKLYSIGANHPEDVSINLFEYIWKQAQKELVKEILDGIDKNIDKIYQGKAVVRNESAKLVAFEEAVKKELLAKYKYLKEKNTLQKKN